MDKRGDREKIRNMVKGIMPFFSRIYNKKSEKLTKDQIDLIETKVEETKKKYSKNSNLISYNTQKRKKYLKQKFVKTGITGFDKLLEKGIPKNTSLLISGGAGSGKTIFCLQTLLNRFS